MTGERVYPDEPAGQFPVPPVAFTDVDGRDIEVRATPPGTGVPEALAEMYAAFDPADRAQGIPPTGADAARRWLETILDEGFNAVAWHGADAAGHATLVPHDGGKVPTAGEAPHGDAGSVSTTSDPAAHGPYELAIFVLQDYQRAGIGTRLLETLLGYAESVGIERVWLSVERWNYPAIELYEHVGFETADSGNFELEMGIRL
jgi:GNAT superfamily N-acetyltransferase